jgi:hypothetical protein
MDLWFGLKLGREIHTYMSGGIMIIEMDGRTVLLMNQERKKESIVCRQAWRCCSFLFFIPFFFSLDTADRQVGGWYGSVSGLTSWWIQILIHAG